jgi:hypothetical protein
VLDGEEEGAAVRGEEGAGELGLNGAASELVDVSAAASGYYEGAVVPEGLVDAFVEPARGDVRDDPEVPAGVEGEVVGARETGLRAAGGEDLEGELLCFCVATVFADPEYLPVEVAVLGVVGEGGVDCAVLSNLYVLAAVERRTDGILLARF